MPLLLDKRSLKPEFKMNKFVIYTAIIGNYDEILQPQVIDDRFDYVLFSNEIEKMSDGLLFSVKF